MIRGVFDFFAGYQWLISKAELRRVLWQMIGLLVVLMLLLIFGVYQFADWLTAYWLPEGDAWYWDMLRWLAHVLAGILAMLLGVVSFTALGSIAAAPWLDSLVARTARLHGVDAPENSTGWLQQSGAAMVHAIRPLAGLLIMGVLALSVVWIPVLGQLAATVLWSIASIRFLNYTLIDTQATRQNLNFSVRRQLFKHSPWYWLGFGGMATLLMFVPLLNVLVIPAAVVAIAHANPNGLK